MTRQFALERIDVHAPAVERNADDVEPVIAKDLEGEEVRRILDEDGVTGSREAVTHEIERLRRTGRQKQRFCAGLVSARAGQERGER